MTAGNCLGSTCARICFPVCYQRASSSPQLRRSVYGLGISETHSGSLTALIQLIANLKHLIYHLQEFVDLLLPAAFAAFCLGGRSFWWVGATFIASRQRDTDPQFWPRFLECASPNLEIPLVYTFLQDDDQQILSIDSWLPSTADGLAFPELCPLGYYDIPNTLVISKTGSAWPLRWRSRSHPPVPASWAHSQEVAQNSCRMEKPVSELGASLCSSRLGHPSVCRLVSCDRAWIGSAGSAIG